MLHPRSMHRTIQLSGLDIECFCNSVDHTSHVFKRVTNILSPDTIFCPPSSYSTNGCMKYGTMSNSALGSGGHPLSYTRVDWGSIPIINPRPGKVLLNIVLAASWTLATEFGILYLILTNAIRIVCFMTRVLTFLVASA
jgi:hypothetical protein